MLPYFCVPLPTVQWIHSLETLALDSLLRLQSLSGMRSLNHSPSSIQFVLLQLPLLSVLFSVVACMNVSTLSTFVIGKRKKDVTEPHKSF